MERDFKGVWIPKEIWLSKELSPIEKFFLTEIIRANVNCEQITSASLSDLFDLTKSRCSQVLKELKEKQYIKVKDARKQDLQVFKKLNKLNSCVGCLFCGYSKSYLDKHHYPKRKKDSGTETINLCPNCHREFHYLADFNYKYEVSGEFFSG